jgi:YVTN family beta-propeller protein
MKYSKIKFLTFFAIICSIGLAPINDASAAENTVIATLTVGTSPEGIAFDSANNRMYVANNGDNTINVINTITNSVYATFLVGINPSGIAFDSANNRMYVANDGANTVDVVSVDTFPSGTNISVGTTPVDVAFDSANNRMYVANYNGDTVSVINTTTKAVDTTISVGDGPRAIAFDSANNRMYVPNYSDDTVSVINTTTNAVDTTISVGDGPRDIAFDSANNRMYVTNSLTTTVSVINTATNAVDATISLTSGPSGIAFDSANNRMYVVQFGLDTVSVINTTTNAVDTTISVGDGPLGIAFDSANNRMYVTNYSAGTVSVIDIAAPSSSSDCYDCTPPTLQSSHITISSNDHVVATGDEPVHITANVGDTVTVTLNVTDDKPVDTIPFAALYTNYQERPSDMSLHYANNYNNLKQVSTSFYEWNIRADDVKFDHEGAISWNDSIPKITATQTDNHQATSDTFTIPFTFTIEQHMDLTQITAKVFDQYYNRLQVTLPVVLHVAGNDPPSFDSNGKVLGFFNESVLNTMILELNGSEDTAPLSEFLGIPDESLPAWTLDLATWVADEKIDSADLIVAVEYLINQ